MTPLATALADALDALPKGAPAIADRLAEMGVQGSCRNPGECAIAEYLNTVVEVPFGFHVSVSNNAAKLTLSHHPVVQPLERVWFLPVGSSTDQQLDRPDIVEFIGNFDRGEYPLLVAGTVTSVAA